MASEIERLRPKLLRWSDDAFRDVMAPEVDALIAAVRTEALAEAEAVCVQARGEFGGVGVGVVLREIRKLRGSG